MSAISFAPVLVRPLGLRDNGLRLRQAQIAEAFPPMTSGKKEQGSSSEISPLSLSLLIRRSKAGENAAMEAIFEHYKGSLFSLAYRYTSNRQAAEDLLQDIFIKIFTHIRDVQNEETFVAWIYRIALNACYSYLRNKRSRVVGTVALKEVEGRIEEAGFDRHEQSLEKPLNDAINELPEKLRTVFLLHDVQGFKHEEIARILGVAAGTSKSQLFKARMRIREFLRGKKYLGEEKK
jgi:RNA polymerase sigma-70 factor (ECF subfamily)